MTLIVAIIWAAIVCEPLDSLYLLHPEDNPCLLLTTVVLLDGFDHLVQVD